MKSVKSVASCVPHIKPYPKLMTSTISGSVLLMTGPCVGVVVSGVTYEGDGIGEYSEYWNSTDLVDYSGSLCPPKD